MLRHLEQQRSKSSKTLDKRIPPHPESSIKPTAPIILQKQARSARTLAQLVGFAGWSECSEGREGITPAA
jgi:hypothetical protein